MTKQCMMDSSVLTAHPLFCRLSKLTRLTLASEILILKKFSKDEIICEQSIYSPTNSRFRKYYEIKLSKFAESIKVNNKKMDLSPEKILDPTLQDSSVSKNSTYKARLSKLREIEKS